MMRSPQIDDCLDLRDQHVRQHRILSSHLGLYLVLKGLQLVDPSLDTWITRGFKYTFTQK